MNMSKDMTRLKAVLDKVPEDRKPIADSLFKEAVFMSRTLDKLKKQIIKDGPTAMFRQGKQEFLREHPAMQAYEKTFPKYSQVFKQIADLLPPAEAEGEKDELMAFVKSD